MAHAHALLAIVRKAEVRRQTEHQLHERFGPTLKEAADALLKAEERRARERAKA